MEQINREELERAAKRIMDMNSRARQAVGGTKVPTPPKKEAPRHEKVGPQVDIKQSIIKRNSIFDIINFKNFAADSDRTLLTGLMLLLGGEMADEKLMLSLLYIML